MKLRVDKPIFTGEETHSPPVTTPSTDTSSQTQLSKLAHDNALNLGFAPKAIVCKKSTITTNPLNWGIVISLTAFPIHGKVTPIGVRWAWQGSQSVVYDWHHYSELVIIHKAISDKDLSALTVEEKALV